MNVFVILIFLSGIHQSLCNEKESCVNEKLRQCSEQYRTSPLFYPSSIDNLKQYCRTFEQKDECLRNSWTECIPQERERQIIISRLNDSLSNHYRHVCNYSTTYSKLFVKYGKCLNLTVAEQNKCQNKYKLMSLPKEELLTAVGYSKNNSKSLNYQKIRQLCCWWVEYQSCTVRAVVDRCGEHAAILVNEEFYKTHTSTATGRVLTYKSCLPQDHSFRYPVCFLDKSIDPQTVGVKFDDKDMAIEDKTRLRDIEETIGLVSNLTSNQSDFANVEASTDSLNNSFNTKCYSKIFITIFIIELIFLVL